MLCYNLFSYSSCIYFYIFGSEIYILLLFYIFMVRSYQLHGRFLYSLKGASEPSLEITSDTGLLKVNYKILNGSLTYNKLIQTLFYKVLSPDFTKICLMNLCLQSNFGGFDENNRLVEIEYL